MVPRNWKDSNGVKVEPSVWSLPQGSSCLSVLAEQHALLSSGLGYSQTDLWWQLAGVTIGWHGFFRCRENWVNGWSAVTAPVTLWKLPILPIPTQMRCHCNIKSTWKPPCAMGRMDSNLLCWPSLMWHRKFVLKKFFTIWIIYWQSTWDDSFPREFFFLRSLLKEL